MILNRRLRTALGALTLFLAAAQSTSAELAEEVRRIAQEAIDAGNAVGVSIGVAQGDKTLLADGYGYANLESKTLATGDTVYRIGSITKQFTAAAILQLAEQEKLGLDEPITKHLPDYPTADHEVTVRHLLQHTSGIQSFTDLPSYRRLMRHDVTHDDIINRFKDLPFHFEPGKRFRYCNSGYYLLGVIVEAQSEATYEEYVQDHLLKPLGMKRTYYDRTRRVIPKRARGYRRRQEGFENAPFLSMTQPFSDGALASTVTDLIRWQRGLVGQEVVNKNSFQQMTTRGARSNGQSIDYGLGLFVRKTEGRQTIGHGGGINGFRSDLTYFPETGHTIVVLANCESANPKQISKKIARILFAENEEPARKEEPKRKEPKRTIEPARNRTATISPNERDRIVQRLPDIRTFAEQRSNRFLVDLDVVRSGHPYRGKNAARPHTGGHVYFSLPERPLTAKDVERFPAIYAVADGVVTRVDYSFRLREMFEPALRRRVANYRYGVGLAFASMDGAPVVFHYSIEPFVDPGDASFYDPFLLVKPGQRVKKGDIIARMYMPKNRELAAKSHIHFNLIGGRDHRFLAPTIFTDAIAKRFHATWRKTGRNNDAHIPPCLGYQLSADENPFGTGAKETL